MKTLKEFMNTKKQIIETYEYIGGFFVDIAETETEWGTEYTAWLYHERYGIKDMMFGVFAKDTTKEGFCEMVLNNIDEEIEFYMDKYIASNGIEEENTITTPEDKYAGHFEVEFTDGFAGLACYEKTLDDIIDILSRVTPHRETKSITWIEH